MLLLSAMLYVRRQLMHKINADDYDCIVDIDRGNDGDC